MRSRTLLPRWLLLLAGIGLVLTSARSHAQRLEDGKNALDEKGRRTRSLRQDLFKGTATANPKDKDSQEAAEIAAKDVVYPLYWSTIGGGEWTPGTMARQLDELESRLQQLTKYKSATEVFQQMYCRQVIERAAEVIQRGKPIAAVNAARMLAVIPERQYERSVLQAEKNWVSDVTPRLADGNGEYLAETCLTLLADRNANAGVKYYLFRTLASLISLPKQTPPLLKKETEEKAVLTAMKFVEKPVTFTRATPRGEVEGYKVLRREALKVVAASNSPVLADKERPAWLLARFAGNDEKVIPAPRLDERIEAAVGLARLAARAAKGSDLAADYAAVQIARCVVDFADRAKSNVGEKPPKRERPWKVDAARLGEAMEDLRLGSKDAYVAGVVKEALFVLALIEKGSAGEGSRLSDWLSRNECPSKTLLKGAPETTVKPAAEK